MSISAYVTNLDLELRLYVLIYNVWGTAPSEISGESTKQYSRQTPVFLGREMLENIRVDS